MHEEDSGHSAAKAQPGQGDELMAGGAWRTTWILIAAVLIAGVFLVPPWNLKIIDYGKLDGAWMALYNEAAFTDRELAFGEDHIFTMGPYAWLRLPFYFPGNVVFQLGWGLILTLALVGGYADSFRRAPTWVKVVGALVFVALPLLAGNRPSKLITSIKVLFVYSHAARDKHSTLSLTDLAFTFVAAVSSLVVFTEFISAVATICIVSAIQWLRFRRFSAVPLLFAVLVSGLWVTMGQSLLAFPAFIRTSLIFSHGYPEAMSRIGAWWEPAAAVGAFLIILAVMVLQCRRKGLLAVCLVVASAMLFYISFKHGFVRQQRPRITMTGVTLVTMAVGYFGLTGQWLKRGQQLVALVPLASALLVSLSFLGAEASPSTAVKVMKRWPVQQGNGIRELITRRGTLEARHERMLSDVREAYPLPRLEGTVDFFGYRQGVVMAHQLDHRPRPAFQSFAVYSPELAEIDAAYYRSEGAPRWVVAEVRGFGGYLAPSMDSQAFLELLQRYEVRQRVKDLIVLERSRRPRPFARRLVLDSEIELGLELSLTQWMHQGPLWVEIEFEERFLVSLVSYLYKPIRLRAALRFADGQSRGYRFAATSARAGFLLSPLVQNENHFTSLAQNRFDSQPATRLVEGFLVESTRRGSMLTPQRGRVRVFVLSRRDSEAEDETTLELGAE